MTIAIKPTLKISTASKLPSDKNVAVVRITEEDHSLTYLTAKGQHEIRMGVGKRKDMNRRKLITLVRDIVNSAKAHKAKKVAVVLDDLLFPNVKASHKDIAELVATNMEMANYAYDTHKAMPKEGRGHVSEAIIVTSEGAAKQGLARGQTIGQYVNLCRDISNTPAHSLPPMKAAETAKRLAKGTKVKIAVMGEKELERKGFGGVTAIGQGAKSESAFIVMEYWGGKKSEKPIVVCGKGVVFDSGGLNIKPGVHMNEMHMDKTGAGATIATILLSEKLGIKRNIISITPFVENMPGGNSIRPGDIIRTLSGKTVQIDNTDAEGRVILSDAITYAKRYKPALLVDVATLTGHMMVALGLHLSGLFCRDEKMAWEFTEMANEAGDYMWPMPLWDVYEPEIKGAYADITNSSPNRYGGSAEAAMFLYQFAKDLDCPWVHLDIAGRMVSTTSDHLAKGSPGDPVRFLLKIVEEWE